MRVVRVGWRPFRVPFRLPYVTAAGVATVREGVIVTLHGEDGLAGLGEASLLPEAGGEVAALLDAVASAAGRVTGAALDDLAGTIASLGDESEVGAAARCAFDVASLDLLGRSAGGSVASLLAADARTEVAVNAIVSVASLDGAAAAARRAVEDGFTTLKLKVGMAADPAAERRRVAAVRDAAGYGVRLRLDANGAWSADQAIRVLGALADHDIELVEQPVAPGNLAALREVRAAVVIPVAADEDVDGFEAARRLIEAGAADLLVLKPMRLGGLRPTAAVAALASAAGLRSIVTTTIDTGIGTAAALQVAASLPAGTPACGLATAALLESDLLESQLAVERGRIRLPAAPGLGVTLAPAALARYCGDERSIAV